MFKTALNLLNNLYVLFIPICVSSVIVYSVERLV
jgi:putative effector of murein hydrolase LrgA (UPF0299 family)